MEHTNNKWDSLSMHERAKYIKLALDNGVSDLSMVRDSFNLYANGGNIHIKPENRGKFTELKERTGKSSTWYKENGTPAQKKMATFALNAAKWSHKHEEGGDLLNNQTYDPAYEGTDSDGTLMFSLPEFTITTDSETGKNIEASIGSTSFNFMNNSYEAESPIWYEENSSNKHKSTKNLKNNNKAQGGYLNNLTSKPFSYKPIPVVRYEEGGFLDRVAKVLNGWFSDDEDTQSDGIDMEELAARQAYAESRYKSNAQSGAGARGLFQIMPSVLSDYNLKNNANYTVDDLYNDTINSQIRNWYFEDLMNRGWNTKNNPSDSVRVAKALAAYNYGSGNVVNQLNKAKAAGVDIYNGWGWLANMPKETRDYVNFVLRNQNSSLHRNNAAYSVSKEANKDKVKLIKEGK